MLHTKQTTLDKTIYYSTEVPGNFAFECISLKLVLNSNLRKINLVCQIVLKSYTTHNSDGPSFYENIWKDLQQINKLQEHRYVELWVNDSVVRDKLYWHNLYRTSNASAMKIGQFPLSYWHGTAAS